MRDADRSRSRAAAARLPAALAVAISVAAALLPSTRVVEPGGWVPGALLLTVFVLGVAAAVRALRWPAVVAGLIAALAWVMALTAVFFRGSAWAFVIPSPETVGFAGSLVSAAVDEMAAGIAPLPATVPVSFFFVAAAGALAVVLDHVVITARLPLLASVAVLAVGLAPAIAVPDRFDGGQVVALAVAVLLLLWTDERTRPGRERRLWSGTSAGALAVASAAMVVAFVATPLLPPPTPPAGAGIGTSIGIDASLRLGEDLRRPAPVDVLTVRSSAGSAPYLRAATLSGFDGSRWRPDRSAVTDVEDGFGPLETDPGIELVEVETHIEVDRLRASYLPVPYAALEIEGLEGTWGLYRQNRTVTALTADTVGQRVDVRSVQARPSLEQIRAASSRGADVPQRYYGLPSATPPEIAATALAVTQGAETDFDALAALQRWFRSSEFSYSLTAPVEDDFDGAGVDAIAQFLQERTGYCIHFASSFAVMARTLGMPTRIVVGYLPGNATDEIVEDQSVYAVTSDLLHAWPEVYFEGIGWVGFEPTNSLGAPPRFTASGSAPSEPLPEAGTPSTAPTDPDALDTPQQDAGGGVPVVGADTAARGWTVTAVTVAGALLVIALPGLAAALRRRARLRTGDPAAAWLTVQETAIDLGIPVPASDSPRALGRRLYAAGADRAAVDRLVRAVEHAAYAPAASAPGAVADAAAAVRASLLGAASPAVRARALLLPRSLVVRPGAAPA